MSETRGQPFPGARPFGHEDRDRFFGRAEAASTVAEWWRVNRLTYVVGPPGRGKTSLLQAGVLPRLADQHADVLPAGRFSYGATFPFAALPPHNPYTLAVLRSWSPGETPGRLAGLTLLEFFERRAGGGVVYAVIDPADELLADTGPRRAQRRSFLGELAEALRGVSRLHLLVVAREEAAWVMADALGNGVRHDLTALPWQSAMEALSRPLALAGTSFADGMAEKLLTDLLNSRITSADGVERQVAADEVEPILLQIAAARLRDSLPPGAGRISDRDIRTYGDVDAALAAHFGMVIAEIADAHDISAKRLTAWLLSTFVTELGTRGQAYESVTTTAGMPNAVVRALEDRYLLTRRMRSGSRWYELLSDRLIEPMRKVTEMRPPAPKAAESLRAAERAFTVGELDLGERYAMEAINTSLKSAIRLHADAYSLLGNIAYEREKPKEAETGYREAMGLLGAVSDNPAVADQLVAVGRMLLAQGRVAEAAEELQAAAGRIPNDLAIQMQLALALWQLGAGRAAVAVLTSALHIDGGNIAALQARGEILADLGDARDAMLDLKRVTVQGRPSTRAARGLALAELGDQLAARQEIEDAVAEGRHNGTVLLYAARAFALGGDEDAAREYAREAADATDPPLSPQHREVARQLAGRDQ